MDFNFFFRRFFNNSNSPRDSFVCDEKDMDDPFENFNSSDPIFRQAEDMFNNVFSFSFGTLDDFPKFVKEMPEQLSPRSIMLKDSDEKTKSFNEKDSEETSALSVESGREHFQGHHAFSFSKISSIRSVYLPDGVVEEYETVMDNNGKKTTLVRRSIGDSTHEVKTKSDKQGLKEKEENFINMDENERHDFEKTWSAFKKKKNPDVADSSPTLTLPSSNYSYLYCLKTFFGL